jgi:glyoxylase-like metal-dependent hydrolase (beta-lactamase superfamily II)
VLPGLAIVPTPVHTPGHQSVILETREGRVIIAGQAAYTVDEYANPERGHVRGLDEARDRESYLESLRRLRELGPRRVHFSHDPTAWEAG